MQLSLLSGIVLVGDLYFALGASSATPMLADAPAQFTGEAESVSLTV